MSFIKNLFGGKKETRAIGVEAAKALCLHVVLVPRWDNPADMGSENKAAGFSCDACHQSFTRDEGLALRAAESDRLRALETHTT